MLLGDPCTPSKSLTECIDAPHGAGVGTSLAATREALVWALAKTVALERVLDEEKDTRRRVQTQLTVARCALSALHSQRASCDSASRADRLAQQLIAGLSRLDAAEEDLDLRAARQAADLHVLEQLRSERAQMRDAAQVLHDACAFRVSDLEARLAQAARARAAAVEAHEELQAQRAAQARREADAGAVLRAQLAEANAGVTALRDALEREQEQGRARARAAQVNVKTLMAQVSGLEEARGAAVRALEAAEEELAAARASAEAREVVVAQLDGQCLAYERALREARAPGRGLPPRGRSRSRPRTAGKENRGGPAGARAHGESAARRADCSDAAARRPRTHATAAAPASGGVSGAPGAARATRERQVGDAAAAAAAAAAAPAPGTAWPAAGREDGAKREAARRVQARPTAVRARGGHAASSPLR